MQQHYSNNRGFVVGAKRHVLMVYSSPCGNVLRCAHNKALKAFVALLLTRTSGCAGRRLAWRYA